MHYVILKEDKIEVIPYGECDFVHINTDRQIKIVVNDKKYVVDKRLEMIEI